MIKFFVSINETIKRYLQSKTISLELWLVPCLEICIKAYLRNEILPMPCEYTF
jgi:hypothetical protein